MRETTSFLLSSSDASDASDMSNDLLSTSSPASSRSVTTSWNSIVFRISFKRERTNRCSAMVKLTAHAGDRVRYFPWGNHGYT